MVAEGLWTFCFQGVLEDPEGRGAQAGQVGQVGLGHLWHLEREGKTERERLIKEP